jgi:hypothetical protein
MGGKALPQNSGLNRGERGLGSIANPAKNLRQFNARHHTQALSIFVAAIWPNLQPHSAGFCQLCCLKNGATVLL